LIKSIYIGKSFIGGQIMKKKLIILVLLLGSLSLSAKDVYVCAGKNGNGTKANPYGKISDAISMGIYAGDIIHVAEGIYYGEGGCGKWIIRINNLTLVGGYNKDFSERNPWKYQTILVRGMGADALAEAKKRGHDKKWGLDFTTTKASYNGVAMIVGEGDHSNTIIDGFIIDGYTRNTYKIDGDLNTSVGPIGSPLVSFNKPGCKVRNCIILNSGGPGIYMVASGKKDDPNSWAEISNCIIINTLMQAIDFRVGTWDPTTDPEGGYALIKNNTLAFVWTHVGEGYGILIGRQTKLTIENNIIAFATDFGMNNGFGNDKSKLINNVFFNNKGGVYRYFASKGSATTVVEDDPTKLTGLPAKKLFYLSEKSQANVTSDPKLKVDPEFFDKFSNQIKSEGGGKVVWDDVNQWRSVLGLPLIGSNGTGKKNYAPIYEHDFMLLFSDAVTVGARKDAKYETYQSASPSGDAKSYTAINISDLKNNVGKDVIFSCKLDKNQEMSGFYVDGIAKDSYICYRTADRNNFIYIKKGSEALETIKQAIAENASVKVSGKVFDISAQIKTSGKFGFICDKAESDE
jgi:hypothetical protein